MKFSMVLSCFQPEELSTIVKAADNAGLDGIAMPDHAVHPVMIAPEYPYASDERSKTPLSADKPQLDAWLVGAYLAAASPRLQYMTSVYLPLLRHPLVTAKAVATLSGLLGDRFIFGSGMGWMREEFECLGIPFAERGARFDETLDILQKMWAGGEVEHHGRFFDFPAIGTNPAPAFPIPFYFGGHSDQMLIRAAKRGDGWICAPKLEMLESQIHRLKKLREEFGRADRPFEFVGMCGGPDRAAIEKMASMGVTHIIMMTPWQPNLPTGPAVIGHKVELIESLGAELSKFR